MFKLLCLMVSCVKTTSEKFEHVLTYKSPSFFFFFLRDTGKRKVLLHKCFLSERGTWLVESIYTWAVTHPSTSD